MGESVVDRSKSCIEAQRLLAGPREGTSKENKKEGTRITASVPV